MYPKRGNHYPEDRGSSPGAGTYTYTVHNWNAYYTQNNWLSSYSNAVVSVYDSRGMLAQISIEPNSGWSASGWKVFELLMNADQTYTVRNINAARPITNYSTADGVRSSRGDAIINIISKDMVGETK